MSEDKWIIDAKEHFKNYGNKQYANGDDISKESQKINENLKKILVSKFSKQDEMKLNLQGSKWNKQGHLILKDHIWYRSYSEKFGEQYPIVFGIALGQNGLNFAIQIYNDAIGNLKISKKLGEIISKIIIEKDYGLDKRKRKNVREDYLDYGYFDLTKFDDDKFNRVMKAYIEVAQEVCKVLDSKLDGLIETYKKFIKSNSVDNPYILLAEKNELVMKRKEIMGKFIQFIEDPIKSNLSSWWSESINSANMQGNFTNLVKNLEDKSKEEVENLKDDDRLEKVHNEFNKIKNIVFDEHCWDIKESLTFDNVEDGVKDVNSMNATAKELAYYLQMDKDKIPLINSMTQRKVELITKIFYPSNKQKTIQEKFELLRDKICKEEEGTYLTVKELKSFYLLDQFLNLIDKVKQKDVDDANEKGYLNLYKQAFEFKNFLGGEEIKNDDFIELLKQGQNIIYYGAPGTGKTFGVLEDVNSTVGNVPERYVNIQFHPSYSYEDFVEGIRPIGIDKSNKSIQFELEDGVFKKFCTEARKEEESFLELKDIDFKSAVEEFGYFFIIDEINRAELSRVFGELLFALEYRGADKGVKTQYSSLRDKDYIFYIPENIFVIGMMNDVDRSIDSFDLALRRRFIWIRKDCNYDVITTECKYTDKEKKQNSYENIENFRQACLHLNEQITLKKNDGLGLGKKYEIGHAYFLKISKYTNGNKISQQSMNKLFDYHMESVLSEYLRSEYNEEDIEKHVKNLKNHFKLESK